MSEYLKSFVPDSFHRSVIFQDQLVQAIERIAERIPQNEVWTRFSTAASPGETGGIAKFPYYRVDTSLASCEIHTILAGRPKTPEQTQRHTALASTSAFETLVWVEIGFGGLEGLIANRTASINLGFSETERQNGQGLASTNEQYERVLRRFATLREGSGVADDDFSRYGM